MYLPCIQNMSHQLIFIFTNVQLDKVIHFYKTSGRLRLLCFHARATRWHRPSTWFFLVEGSLTVRNPGEKDWRFWGRGTLSSCFGNTTPTLFSNFNWNLSDVYVLYIRCLSLSINSYLTVCCLGPLDIMLVFNYISLSILPKGTIDHILLCSFWSMILGKACGQGAWADAIATSEHRGTLTMFQMVQKSTRL